MYPPEAFPFADSSLGLACRQAPDAGLRGKLCFIFTCAPLRGNNSFSLFITFESLECWTLVQTIPPLVFYFPLNKKMFHLLPNMRIINFFYLSNSHNHASFLKNNYNIRPVKVITWVLTPFFCNFFTKVCGISTVALKEHISEWCCSNATFDNRLGNNTSLQTYFPWSPVRVTSFFQEAMCFIKKKWSLKYKHRR
jgi:hypothetical protein